MVIAVFALAQAQVFAPSEPAAAPTGTGDAGRGQTVFRENCAGCHGDAGQGGVGPQLAGSGLEAAQVSSAVQQGRGVMPAGLVSGRELADVVAYVVSISSPPQ